MAIQPSTAMNLGIRWRFGYRLDRFGCWRNHHTPAGTTTTMTNSTTTRVSPWISAIRQRYRAPARVDEFPESPILEVSEELTLTDYRRADRSA